MYNDSRKNQGNSHTLLRLKQRTLQKILVGLDIFRKLLYNDDSRKNQGGIIVVEISRAGATTTYSNFSCILDIW